MRLADLRGVFARPRVSKVAHEAARILEYLRAQDRLLARIPSINIAAPPADDVQWVDDGTPEADIARQQGAVEDYSEVEWQTPESEDDLAEMMRLAESLSGASEVQVGGGDWQ